MESIFKKLMSRPGWSIICLGLLLLLVGDWILPITDRDEARFSEASREMIQRGDYVVPWFNGAWRLYKPALIYWCQIGSYRVLGINDFSARVPTVLFTVATALLLVQWGRKIADAKTGFLAGAMFLTCLHVAIVGRIATADMAMVFFFTLVAWSGWEVTRPQQSARWKWWWILYVALGLGFLAKGPEAWLPLVAMALGRATRKDSFQLPFKETAAGIVLSVAIVAAWGIPALVRTHGAFWSVGMNEQVYQRAVAVNNSHGFAGLLGFVLMLPYYFLTFFVSFFPWSTRVPASLRRWWQERERDDVGWYLLTVAAIVFIVFSLVKTKLPHYTMPAFPCLTLWLALQLRSDATSFAWFQTRFVAMVILIPTIMLGVAIAAKNYTLTERLWAAVQPDVLPGTKVGCFGYVEPTLVWKFRSVVTNIVVLGDENVAKNFLTNQPPFILVLPTRDAASIPDFDGVKINVHGLDMVRFKNRDLTAIVRFAPHTRD
jgi:4-amino-4-deoxy-L-arabinose transferase-like glycosyltransferase